MGAVVLTPICPHMLTNRPLVLPDELEVEIGIVSHSEDQEVYLTLDGQEGFPIAETDRVCVRKSEHRILLVQSPEKNYFDVLRTKLKWGESER
jgi:NAD+ kinase